MGNSTGRQSEHGHARAQENPPKQTKHAKEHKRFGMVQVKIHTSNPARRNSETQINHVITPKGAVMYGSIFDPKNIMAGTNILPITNIIPSNKLSYSFGSC